jgi:LacI family transcriptional regulator
LQSYQRLVKSRRVDGLIVSRTRVIDPRIEYLLSADMPFVAHGRSESLIDYPWFDFDNQTGVELAALALLKLGHRTIAYVHSPMSLNFSLQRYLGFEKTMQAAGINDYSKYLYLAGMNRRSGYDVVQRILSAKPRPTAIIVDNNLCGVGVVRGLIDAQITMGKDISVVIYDGVPADTLLPGHSIASIEQPTAYEAGKKMADMLLTLIKGEELEERNVLWQPKFVAANSIGRVS